MPTIDGASLNGLLSSPLVLRRRRAGGVVRAAVMMLADAAAGRGRRLLLPIVALALAGLAVVSLDRMAQDERAAERRALMQRNAELTAQALTPGSALACLDGAAGEAIENACEKAVFADPQSAAGAVAYMAARLTLLADALAFARRGDPDLPRARRPAPRDRTRPLRYRRPCAGHRDGCTAERCAVFALLRDTGVIKANLKAQAFDQYVARYAAAWNKAGAGRRWPTGAGAGRRSPACRTRAGQGPGAEQIRFPLGRLDPAGQHHECRAAAAEGGGRCARPRSAAAPTPSRRPRRRAARPPPTRARPRRKRRADPLRTARCHALVSALTPGPCMFTSVLIANRGEIACRIARTAKRLGLRTIAVYSEADANALHVRLCRRGARDRAGARGRKLSAHRRADRRRARRRAPNASIPATAFSSENAEFAQACADAGIVFVGPPPAAIRAMGLKDRAKALMEKAGVPVVPGYHGERQEPKFLKQKAYEIGYPVLIKAVAGGGGKGMRRVDRHADFDAALGAASARRKPRSATRAC